LLHEITSVLHTVIKEISVRVYTANYYIIVVGRKVLSLGLLFVEQK